MSKVKTQEPFWTYSADTRDTRLAHEKMPEPEEEPAETTVAQDLSAGTTGVAKLVFRLAWGSMVQASLNPGSSKAGPLQDATAGRALEQSSRYADLTLDEAG